MPVLSVVIIGRNEGERLVRCIRSVQHMHSPPEMEIIYVDSNSTDGSPEQAEKLGAKVLTVKPERPSAALGRNAGWQVATAPFVLFLDGDTMVDPDFINKALSKLETMSNVAIVWGNLQELRPDASIYQRILNLDWIYPTGFVEFSGGNALMRRDVLVQVNGFNADLIAGEEPEMCNRIRALGYKILHINEPMGLHDLGMTRWSQYWKRSTRTGFAYADISERFKHTHLPLWRRETLKNFLHASVLIGVFFVGLLLSLVYTTILPFAIGLTILTLLGLRSAWKARWKSNNKWTLFLYGLHSQFQHIPIAVGQISYYYKRWRGKKQGLIEYK